MYEHWGGKSGKDVEGENSRSRGQKKRTKEQTRATDTIDPEANPNDTFTPTGPYVFIIRARCLPVTEQEHWFAGG